MKKVLLISGILLTFVIGVYFYYYSDSQKSVLENSKSKQIINSNSLTMMYETEYQSGEYQVSTETTWPQEGYTFNEALSKCENGGVLTWDDENKKVLLQTNTSDKCYVYFDKEPNTLANYIINNVYTGTDGDNGLYYHDGIGSYTNADQEAGDNSYRYSGADPNNYVCFGSNDIHCPEDNLYRIIGIFENEIKLIKSTSIGEYAWDSGSENIWNESRKPSIHTTLNTTYYETLSPNWRVLINKVHSWQVGGMNSNGGNAIGSVKEVYNNEIGINQNGYEEAMAIGLMYVSDYGYATYPYAWTTDLTNYNNSNIIANNWLSSEYEWTITLGIEITRAFFAFPSAFAIYKWKVFSNGDYTKVTNENSIRPCFYLNFDVQYISGTGTQSDPYRIA